MTFSIFLLETRNKSLHFQNIFAFAEYIYLSRFHNSVNYFFWLILQPSDKMKQTHFSGDERKKVLPPCNSNRNSNRKWKKNKWKI